MDTRGYADGNAQPLLQHMAARLAANLHELGLNARAGLLEVLRHGGGFCRRHQSASLVSQWV